MRKLFALLMIFAFVLALGCAKKIETAPEPVQPASLPELNQIPPEPVEAPVVAPEPEPTPQEPAPLGNRVEGTQQEAVEETVSEGVVEIGLTADKTMTETERTVSVGTTLAWKNNDAGWPHVLAVESGKGFDTIRHARSEQILDGEVFEYTFNEKGTFLVRDLFSGSMRMTVTVE